MRTLALILSLSVAAPAFAEPPPPPHRGERLEQARDREAEVLDWIAEQDPDKAERLGALRERDPERYRMHIRRAARMMKASENDPELLERKQRMREIHEELRGLSVLPADDKKVAKVREARVRELVEEAVDLRLAGAAARIDAMEAKLEEAREKLEEAESERDQMIEDHVEKVLSGEAPERPGR